MSQNRDDLPYFPYYASNILADKRYKLMSMEERGLWISMYSDCWPNHSVPADPESLAKYLGFPTEQVKACLTERVLSFFKEVKGELISAQLEQYFHKQIKIREKKSEGGKKGANRRYNKDLEDVGQPIGPPITQPTGKPIGSLNTIKSNSIKSTSVFTKKEKVEDEFVAEMEAEEARIKASPRAKARV